MKIGFFGGCFNPPTIAHISLAEKVLKDAKLDKVIFVPVGDFYKKRELVPAIYRYNMLKIATKDLPNIEVSELEIRKTEIIYAVDVFRLIKKEYQNDDIYFIMGADNFINIMNWKESKELLKEYKYIVIEREGFDIKEYINTNFKDKNNILIIKNEEYKDYSSSKFREKAKLTKQYSRDVIPEKVIEYIEKNNIF